MVRPLGAQAGAGHVKPLHGRAGNDERLVRCRPRRGLFKKRIARPGQGKSGGYRTLVATNKGNRWVFVYGFPKNKRSNIDKDEEEALKNLAAHLLSLTAQAVTKARQAGELIEVDCDA